MTTSFEKGVRAEQIAARFLTHVQHMTILQHRYKTYVGEIDLIAMDNNVLVAIEIKQRNTINDARLAITPHQQKRIQKSMEVFLCYQPIPYDGIRFDAILFDNTLTERVYVKNAWFVR